MQNSSLKIEPITGNEDLNGEFKMLCRERKLM